MPFSAFDQLPMTPLEEKFKECLLQRPDMRSRIPSSDEIPQYIAWMAQTYGNETLSALPPLPVLACSPDFLDIAQTLLTDPTNSTAITRLTSGYRTHSESFFFPADQDISVSRQLRYLPSHWHSSTYFEIYYAFSGNCPIHFQDEVIELKQGTVLIVAPSAVHANPCFSDDSVLVYYMVRASTFDQVFWKQIPSDSLMATFFRQALNNQHPSSYLHFQTGNDEDIRRLLFQIYHEYHLDEPYKAQLLNSLMSSFFILLLRRYEGTARLPRTEDFFWKHEFSAILSHIQTNYATVTQAELSQRFHYSQRQISRIVQSCMGMSYSDLILKMRMETAAKLISQKNISMDAIAATVGYSTPSSFYRAFTKYYGCTPGAYQASIASR